MDIKSLKVYILVLPESHIERSPRGATLIPFVRSRAGEIRLASTATLDFSLPGVGLLGSRVSAMWELEETQNRLQANYGLNIRSLGT